MDTDRVKGSVKKIKGDAKEKIGELIDDEKLKNEGKADQVEGAIQNTAGGVKDAIRGDK